MNRAWRDWVSRQDATAQEILTFVERFSTECEGWQLLESPLEVFFFAEWFAAHVASAIAGARSPLLLRPQVQVVARNCQYRLDFVVVPIEPLHLAVLRATRTPFMFAVELDGHAFHERTVEQVAHRNKRDRDLQAAGWRLFHFSGSELHRNCLGCVGEVYRAACDALDKVVERVTAGWKVSTEPIDFNEDWLVNP
jgi:hypothetical protein